MKRFYALITVMMFVFSVNAQYIYNDFDANQNETFEGWPNMPTVVANPDISGINTSANVAEWMRSGEQWAHVYCPLEGTVDFTTGTVFELKVHIPIACTILFKLEDGNGGSTELSADVTTVNEWTQLSFDFTGATTDVYNQIVIFFDFASTTDNTYYFDDVTGPEVGAGSGIPVDLPVTFDDDEVLYGLTDFGGNVSEIVVDPENPANSVAQTLKTAGAETWAGTTVGGTLGFANPIPLAPGSTIMSVDVWSPTAGIPVRLKVEDHNVAEHSVETEAMTTVAMEWETLVFDFSNEAPGTAEIDFSYIYDKASIFFDFGTNGTGATYYWDNMEFGISTRISENIIEETNVYPNPVSDVLYLENAVNLKNISIYSVVGQIVYQSEKVNNSINISDFPVGIYTLRANGNDGKQYFAKFIVK
jgi:hypothetical protein